MMWSRFISLFNTPCFEDQNSWSAWRRFEVDTRFKRREDTTFFFNAKWLIIKSKNLLIWAETTWNQFCYRPFCYFEGGTDSKMFLINTKSAKQINVTRFPVQGKSVTTDFFIKKKKHVTGPVHHFTSCVCVMSVVLTWAERSDAFILCSIGRSIAPRRLLSTVDLLASRLNVGGLETVDILFTLVQEVNWNRAGPFLHEWLRFLSRKKKKERETDGEIKTRQKNRTDPPVLFKFARPRYVKVWERERCGGPGDALIGACMLGLFSCLPFSCRTGKKKKQNTCLSLAVDCRQTLASWCVHRPVWGARGDTEEDYIYLRG